MVDPTSIVITRAVRLKTAVVLLLPLAWFHRFDAWKIIVSFGLVTAPFLLCLPLLEVMLAIYTRRPRRFEPPTQAAIRTLAVAFARLVEPGRIPLVVLACAAAVQLWLHKGSPYALAAIPVLVVFSLPWFSRDSVAACSSMSSLSGWPNRMFSRIFNMANALVYTGFFFFGITTWFRDLGGDRMGAALAMAGLGGAAAWMAGSCVAALVVKGNPELRATRQAFDLWLSADRLALLALLVPALPGIGLLAAGTWDARRGLEDIRLLRVVLAFSTCGLLVAAHALIRPLEVWCRNRAVVVPPWGVLAVLNAGQAVALILAFAIVFRT
jgi:hypothetical protein